MRHDDELLDIVDQQDRVIGQQWRSHVYATDAVNFRVVNAFVVNSHGQIWLPRRSAHKRTFPLCLDMSMGGHVESGESYDQALRRELGEELGIHLEDVVWRLLGYLTPYIDHVSAFMNVYEIHTDTAPIYNQDDFIEGYWFTAREALERIQQGDRSKRDLPILLRRFYH